MKRILFVVFVLTTSYSVNSQIRRGISPYRFVPDIYIGTEIGPNVYFSEDFSVYGLKGSFGLTESVFFGYNFMEFLGVRALGSFSNMNWPDVRYGTNVKFSTLSMSVEVLVNLSNYFDRYNLDRPFDFSLFTGFGFINREKATFQSNYGGLIWDGGIIANYRLNYMLDINASLTGHIVGDNFNEFLIESSIEGYPAIKIGLTYHIR
jgi:hypothetical protein